MIDYLNSPMPIFVGLLSPPSITINDDNFCHVVVDPTTLTTSFSSSPNIKESEILANQLKPAFKGFKQDRQKHIKSKKKLSSPKFRPTFEEYEDSALEVSQIARSFVKYQLIEKLPSAREVTQACEKYEKLQMLDNAIDKNLFIVEDVGLQFLQRCSPNLQQFGQQFRNSQMFYSFIDDISISSFGSSKTY